MAVAGVVVVARAIEVGGQLLRRRLRLQADGIKAVLLAQGAAELDACCPTTIWLRGANLIDTGQPAILAVAYHLLVGSNGPVSRHSSLIGCGARRG